MKKINIKKGQLLKGEFKKTPKPAKIDFYPPRNNPLLREKGNNGSVFSSNLIIILNLEGQLKVFYMKFNWQIIYINKFG